MLQHPMFSQYNGQWMHGQASQYHNNFNDFLLGTAIDSLSYLNQQQQAVAMSMLAPTASNFPDMSLPPQMGEHTQHQLLLQQYQQQQQQLLQQQQSRYESALLEHYQQQTQSRSQPCSYNHLYNFQINSQYPSGAIGINHLPACKKSNSAPKAELDADEGVDEEENDTNTTSEEPSSQLDYANDVNQLEPNKEHDMPRGSVQHNSKVFPTVLHRKIATK